MKQAIIQLYRFSYVENNSATGSPSISDLVNTVLSIGLMTNGNETDSNIREPLVQR